MIIIWLTFLFNMVCGFISSWGLCFAIVVALYGMYNVKNRRNPEPGTGAGVELDLERQEDMFGFAELKRRGSGRR